LSPFFADTQYIFRNVSKIAGGGFHFQMNFKAFFKNLTVKSFYSSLLKRVILNHHEKIMLLKSYLLFSFSFLRGG